MGEQHALGLIDTATCNIFVRTSCGDTVAHAPLGGYPGPMTIDLKTNTLYLTDFDRQVLHVIDTTHCTATRHDGCQPFASIPIPNLGVPTVNSVTHTVYVTQGGDQPQLAVVQGYRCNTSNRSGCAGPVLSIPISDYAGIASVDTSTNTIYVTNNSTTMDVVDGAGCDAGTTACRVVATTGEGVGRQGAASDHASHTLYVAGGEENTSGYVSVVDTLHCRATDVTRCQASWPKIPTGRGTFGATFHPSTRTIFTTNVLDASMNIVDVRHCKASDHSHCAATSPRIAVGIFPIASAVDARRNTLYASNGGDLTESIINLRHPCSHHLCFR